MIVYRSYMIRGGQELTLGGCALIILYVLLFAVSCSKNKIIQNLISFNLEK